MENLYTLSFNKSNLSDTSIIAEMHILSETAVGEDVHYEAQIPKELIFRLSNAVAHGPFFVRVWSLSDDRGFVLLGANDEHKALTFPVLRSDTSSWALAVEEGRARGVPEDQLDFSTPN